MQQREEKILLGLFHTFIVFSIVPCMFIHGFNSFRKCSVDRQTWELQQKNDSHGLFYLLTGDLHGSCLFLKYNQNEKKKILSVVRRIQDEINNPTTSRKLNYIHFTLAVWMTLHMLNGPPHFPGGLSNVTSSCAWQVCFHLAFTDLRLCSRLLLLLPPPTLTNLVLVWCLKWSVISSRKESIYLLALLNKLY